MLDRVEIYVEGFSLYTTDYQSESSESKKNILRLLFMVKKQKQNKKISEKSIIKNPYTYILSVFQNQQKCFLFLQSYNTKTNSVKHKKNSKQITD